MGVLLGLLILLDQWIKLLYQLGHWHHSLSQGKQLNPLIQRSLMRVDRQDQ
jgi:hypothetical protein|uniref:Uncharacterized protein n=1 Tax=Picea glauca TaxID=3330 RepID=A0A101LZG4_PICGL|nr:hypothetical protein ABT39_MTgene5226 [Picea glauca]